MTDKKAVLYSFEEPSAAQKERLAAFIKKKYGDGFSFEWENDEKIKKGFKLAVGSEIYDWTDAGRFR